MRITQEEVVDHQAVLQIELESSDLDPYLDRGYRRLAPRTMIPGFRKGKAPRRVVEGFLGRERLISEVLDSMAPEVAERAIDEQDLDAFGQPRIELVELDPFTLKATVPLTPEADLSYYKDIRVELEQAEVTDEDVDGRIEEMRNRDGTWEPVERPVALGDMVILDVEGSAEDKTILDQKDVNYVVSEDGNPTLPGFSENLVGLEVDTPGEFVLSIPEDNPDTNVAGKQATFRVDVKDIKELKLPDLDDEFAKGVGDGYDDLAALRHSVRDELGERAEELKALEHREKVLDALLEGLSVEMPRVMVERGIEQRESERAAFLQRLNIRVDDYLSSVGKTEEEARSEMEEEVTRRLRLSFAVSKIAELEGVEVAADELEARVDAMKSRGNGEVSAEAARESLLAEKAVDRLVEIAKA